MQLHQRLCQEYMEPRSSLRKIKYSFRTPGNNDDKLVLHRVEHFIYRAIRANLRNFQHLETVSGRFVRSEEFKWGPMERIDGVVHNYVSK